MINPNEIPKRWIFGRQHLEGEMRRSIRFGNPQAVNLSAPRHFVTTPALWSLAYDQSLNGQALKVTFRDGSMPREFPAGSLTSIDSLPPKPSQTRLRVGLMSFRHPELDFLVDLYVCRNLELARDLSIAEEEAYAYKAGIELLDDDIFQEGGVIEVYHTGLEQMVVGFYRAVVSILEFRQTQLQRRDLRIQSMFFNAKGTSEDLTPDSPGANPANYVKLVEWY